MSVKYKAFGNDRSVVFHHIFIEDDHCRFVWYGRMFCFAAMEKQNTEIEKNGKKTIHRICYHILI